MSESSRKRLQEALEKNHPYYVLITCGEPTEDGHMQVKMTYRGDATLASYLLQSAQCFIDQEEDLQESTKPIPIQSLE